MKDMIVLGERCDDLAFEMLALDFEVRPDEMAEIRGTVAIDGPLVRAMYRAEAELLLADAESMSLGVHVHRTPEQRRCDAFCLVFVRLTDVVKKQRRSA